MSTRIKSAFVTGAATGIGEGLVNKLQAEGWQVFAGYRSAAPEKASWFGKAHVVIIPVHLNPIVQPLRLRWLGLFDYALSPYPCRVAYGGTQRQ